MLASLTSRRSHSTFSARRHTGGKAANQSPYLALILFRQPDQQLEAGRVIIILVVNLRRLRGSPSVRSRTASRPPAYTRSHLVGADVDPRRGLQARVTLHPGLPGREQGAVPDRPTRYSGIRIASKLIRGGHSLAGGILPSARSATQSLGDVISPAHLPQQRLSVALQCPPGGEMRPLREARQAGKMK